MLQYIELFSKISKFKKILIRSYIPVHVDVGEYIYIYIYVERICNPFYTHLCKRM